MENQIGPTPEAAPPEQELATLRRRNRELEIELAGARLELEELGRERRRLERLAARHRAELEKVQGHLTRILASRLFRYSRALRRIWYRLKGSG